MLKGGRRRGRIAFPVDPFLASLVGAVLLAILLPARGVAAVVVDHAVIAAIALLFFLYGARLSPAAVAAGLGHWRLQGLVFLASFGLFPLVGLVASTLARPFMPASLDIGLLFVCLLPSTVQSSIAFTAIAGGNVSAALCGASVSNLAGMVVTPLLVTLLLGAHGPGVGLDGLRDIALHLLLPFVVGQVARPVIGGLIARGGSLTALVDRGSILIIVYAAFSEGMVSGIWSRLTPASFALVVVLDSVVLAIILVATTLASRWLGFSREDEIAIVFCGSKKSLAAGIPMANILFPGQATGLILLPMMLFHQIQLFVCATLARRYARARVAAMTPEGDA